MEQTKPKRKANPSLSSITRRTFLAEAAATIAAGPTLLRASFLEPPMSGFLHLATRSSQIGHIHTFALSSSGYRLLGSSVADTFAAFALHPSLPVLYVARDCSQWKGLPRGVVETYAVVRDERPLRLLAQTPMALSATGPKSVAVSCCGRHLLVSASKGGAWNSFALDQNGVPASVAIARKETGTTKSPHATLLPAPHAVIFAPHRPIAVGTDLGIDRLTLLEPSADGIAVLDRYSAPFGLASVHPVWTSDGKHIVAASERNASLSLFVVTATSEAASKNRMQLMRTVPTTTPATTLLSHPTDPAVFISRPHLGGSCVECWKIQGDFLQRTDSTWISNPVFALTRNESALWAASSDRLIRMSIQDLRSQSSFQMQLPTGDIQAMVVQNAPS